MAANLDAIQKTVAGLREDGRIPVEGEALVQICMSLAAAVDATPDNAALWREYRQAEQSLRGLEELTEGDVDRLIAAIRDPEDESAQPWTETGVDS